MSNEYINLVIPSKPEIISSEGNSATFAIEGLYPGYGNTLGSSLRRMLLSSIPGIAITKIKIKGVPHEFSVIDGIKEDVLQIILNMKNIKIKSNTESFPQSIKLVKKGKGKITASDFEVPSQVEIVNKDLHICEITDEKTELNIEAEVNRGIGFKPRDEELKENKEVGVIVVDSVFSPVKRSSYEVKNMRVGERTDFNKLEIFIQTDGTLTPEEALEKSIKTMISQFQAMIGFQTDDKKRLESIEDDSKKETGSITIEELNFNTSILSLLKKNNINTLEDLLSIGLSGLKEMQGVGDKSVDEVVTKLEERGVVLKN